MCRRDPAIPSPDGALPPILAYGRISAQFRKGVDVHAAIPLLGGPGHRVHLFDDHPGRRAGVLLLRGAPSRSQRTLLGFAAGVMAGVSLWDLFPEAISLLAGALDRRRGFWLLFAAFLAGIALTFAIDRLVPDGRSRGKGRPAAPRGSAARR